MYHYIRERKKSMFPKIKSLEYSEFKNQINYFTKNFNVLNYADFIETLKKKNFKKKPSVLLTFDDAYKDHYNYAYPFLQKKKISGIFYTPVNVIKNNVILDVNKIHLILSKEPNRKKIINSISLNLRKYFNIKLDDILKKYKTHQTRYDDRETNLIKGLLQKNLDEKVRNFIINKLFKIIINIDERELSKDFYLNEKEINEMSKEKMAFGFHGYNHYWMNEISEKKQELELKKALNYFSSIGININNISASYPYGSFNETTIKLLKKYKFSFAVTTIVDRLSKSNINSRYTLPRYDTNDFKI